MNFNCLELLVLVTIGAVSPYVVVAVVTWSQQLGKHNFGANAPSWLRFPKLQEKDKCCS